MTPAPTELNGWRSSAGKSSTRSTRVTPKLPNIRRISKFSTEMMEGRFIAQIGVKIPIYAGITYEFG